jgi:hypothetical protein
MGETQKFEVMSDDPNIMSACKTYYIYPKYVWGHAIPWVGNIMEEKSSAGYEFSGIEILIRIGCWI